MLDKPRNKFPKDNVEDEDCGRAAGKGYGRKLK
jgi:hypothetical protein